VNEVKDSVDIGFDNKDDEMPFCGNNVYNIRYYLSEEVQCLIPQP
jgi:hypothetical protein